MNAAMAVVQIVLLMMQAPVTRCAKGQVKMWRQEGASVFQECVTPNASSSAGYSTRLSGPDGVSQCLTCVKGSLATGDCELEWRECQLANNPKAKCKPDTKCVQGAWGSVNTERKPDTTINFPTVTMTFPAASKTITFPPYDPKPGDCFKLSKSMALEKIRCPIDGLVGNASDYLKLEPPLPSCNVNPNMKPCQRALDEPALPGDKWTAMFGNPDYSNPHEEWKVVDHIGYVRSWTCADKSRVLETSEDGKRWCRKVQN